MELVVFSTPDRSLSEAKEVIRLFEEGLTCFHLKKSGFERHEMEEYIKSIPSKYHPYIFLHSNHQLRKKFKIGGLHLSRTHLKRRYNSRWKMFKIRYLSGSLKFTRTFSKLSTLSSNRKKYDYVFLSPIYDGISKLGHSGNFGNRSMKKNIELSKSPVYALGGVTAEKIEECHEVGFSGVGLLGYIWKNEEMSPLEAFLEAKKRVEQL